MLDKVDAPAMSGRQEKGPPSKLMSDGDTQAKK